MDDIKKQVKELIENQNHILVAIKYLDERLKAGPGNANDKENATTIQNLETKIINIFID